MNIAIVTGWTSSERSVALRSSDNMAEWCQTAGHTVSIYDFPSDIPTFLEKYTIYDQVIPVFHGMYGEDGQVTAFLSTLGCRYSYSDFDVHALCMNKNIANLYLSNLGIRVPKSIFFPKWSESSNINIPFPVIVKPNRGGSSIATNKAKNQDELLSAFGEITGDDILVQECIEWREFTVWVYRDTSGYHVLPIVEIKTLHESFFDYSEKYETDGSNEVFLEWETELIQNLENETLKIANIIQPKWVVRIDYRYDGSDLYFLEVNTIPGFTSGSLVPKMWKKAWKNEEEFINMLYL